MVNTLSQRATNADIMKALRSAWHGASRLAPFSPAAWNELSVGCLAVALDGMSRTIAP